MEEFVCEVLTNSTQGGDLLSQCLYIGHIGPTSISSRSSLNQH